jgi:hypothetical protein
LKNNYILKQNNDLIKTDDLYSLDYQFIIKEPDYSTFYNNANEVINYPSDADDQSSNFSPEIFYGKTHSTKFKLCHDYCATCKNIGISNDDQKCLSCLEDYQYDIFNEYPSNCVPSGYYKDRENNDNLVVCDSSNSKFYIDRINNKTICFKNDYDCPRDYPNFNASTRECLTIGVCTYTDLLNNICSFIYYNNTEIYKKIKSEIIDTYPPNGESVVILGEENYVYQLTTSRNEKNSLNGIYDNNYNLSMIDLGECEQLLKTENNIHDDVNLIFLKFEKLTKEASEKNVQFEVYNPNNKSQLDLSICYSTPVNLYMPVTLNENTQSLYNNLKESGYDLFNENDSFYKDICTPYKSENDTDVLLSDRKNDYFGNNNNETTCQSNCKYSDYSSETHFLKCECSIISNDIDTEEPEQFTETKIFESFYEVLKYSNYKVLKCYKLVFNLDILKKNFGSIIIMIAFLVYITCLFVFIFKNISPLRIEIHKNLNDKIRFDYNEKIIDEKNNNKELKIKLKNQKDKDQKKDDKKRNIKVMKKKIIENLYHISHQGKYSHLQIM